MSSAASTVDQSILRGGYRTTPDHETTGWPPGVPYIIGNEACERFSYYGMRAILYAHLLSLYVLAGETAEHAKSLATGTTHLFFAGVYALPMIGALLADRFAGKYRTIFYLSLVYCAGHAVLSIGESSLTGMYIGLALIAVGSGGIKPCVSANVGDQFGKNNWFRIRTVYQIFYFSVNFGSFFSTLLIPIVKTHSGHWVASVWPGVTQHIELDRLGTSIAFGIPGILMFIATLIFWMGRKKFIHVPPKPGGRLGLLDALSSACLFLTFGHLFVSAGWEWWKIVLLSVAFLAAGLALFAWRQKLEPDDGFLAITLFAIWRRIRGDTSEPEPLAGVKQQSPNEPGGEAQPGGVSAGIKEGPPDPFAGPLADSRLWGPAVRRYGHEAVEGPVAVFKIISVFFLVSVFWALFDQHSSTWIEQARHMDRTVTLPWGKTLTLEATQIPALNPLMVMILIPLMNFVYVGFDSVGLRTTPLRRITVGMLVTASSFAAVAIIQEWIDTHGQGAVNIAWQIIPYLLLTVGEVMVSITGLEFAYTQAPRRMKSTVMGFWLLTVTLGNVLVVFLAGFKGLALVKFFWIFAALMAGAGLIFGIRAYFYTPKDYAQ